jgi:hypothetical protein
MHGCPSCLAPLANRLRTAERSGAVAAMVCLSGPSAPTVQDGQDLAGLPVHWAAARVWDLPQGFVMVSSAPPGRPPPPAASSLAPECPLLPNRIQMSYQRIQMSYSIFQIGSRVPLSAPKGRCRHVACVLNRIQMSYSTFQLGICCGGAPGRPSIPPSITDTSTTNLVLFGMQNRTFGPCLAAMHRTLTSAMPSLPRR